MYKASRITGIIGGVIVLSFGILSLTVKTSAFSDNITAGMVYPLCGVSFIISGICGIMGGLLLSAYTRTGRALLLTAGILGLPFFALTGSVFGLAFFMLFLTARNRAKKQWPEDEPASPTKTAGH